MRRSGGSAKMFWPIDGRRPSLRCYRQRRISVCKRAISLGSRAGRPLAGHGATRIREVFQSIRTNRADPNNGHFEGDFVLSTYHGIRDGPGQRGRNIRRKTDFLLQWFYFSLGSVFVVRMSLKKRPIIWVYKIKNQKRVRPKPWYNG